MCYVKINDLSFGVFANTWAGFIFMAAVLVIVMLIFERVKRHILRWTMN